MNKITIEDVQDGFGDVMYKGESIGIVEVEDNVIRLRGSLESCMNDDRSFDEIIQFRNELPELKQAVINLGYKLEKEIDGDKDIDEESIVDLRNQYSACF